MTYRDYDVLVVGGGNAGCAAALAAARHGARTLLVERYGFLGGTATAAMVGPWMTFHSGTDRIVGGIAQEIVERLIALGGPRTVRAKRTIDATADAFVAAAAGAALQQGDERGRVQPASLMFRLSHVDMNAVATYVREHPDQMRTSLEPSERTADALTAVAGLYE